MKRFRVRLFHTLVEVLDVYVQAECEAQARRFAERAEFEGEVELKGEWVPKEVIETGIAESEEVGGACTPDDLKEEDFEEEE